MAATYHQTTTFVKPPAMARRGSKKAAILAMLQRSKGTTQAECLAKTGWRAINLVRAARQSGLTLRTTTERGLRRRVTRYFATRDTLEIRAERMLAQAAELCRINRTLIQRLDQLVGNKERLLEAAIALEAAE
jgi:hypothetical protein